MLSWKVSRDGRIASLSCVQAKLLYTWMIPHCDNLGRMRGEPHEVRATVFPREVTTEAEVGGWLGEMNQSGLICWYQDDGMRYVQMTGWEKHQRLVGNMRKVSHLPGPSEEEYTACIQRSYGVHPEGEGRR